MHTQSITQSLTHPAYLMPREPKLALQNLSVLLKTDGSEQGLCSHVQLCRRHILYSYKITFWNNSSISEPIWTKFFSGRRRVTWHASLQTFGTLCRTGAKWRPHFANFFCQQNASFQTLPLGTIVTLLRVVLHSIC